MWGLIDVMKVRGGVFFPNTSNLAFAYQEIGIA